MTMSSDSDDYSSDDEIYTHCSSKAEKDIEAFTFVCLTTDKIREMLSQEAAGLQESLKLSDEGVARMLLQHFDWDIKIIIDRFTEDSAQTLEEAGIRPPATAASSSAVEAPSNEIAKDVYECQTCLEDVQELASRSLECGHISCVDCWMAYTQMEISEGRSTTIACMAQGCSLLLPQSFVLQTIPQSDEKLKERYLQSCFNSWVQCHPRLRFCVGKDCPAVIKAEKNEAKRVVCTMCKTQFCFACGEDYHVPTDCQTMKMWLARDPDSTAAGFYIQNHIKLCPRCGISIKKDGGCNWITCRYCNCEFCWLCVRHKVAFSHGCPMFDVEPERITIESDLPEDISYYMRWHTLGELLRSLDDTRRQTNARIRQRLIVQEGRWVDWQHLFTAADVLAKSRYTLRYTYPFTFYLEPGPRKDLFEHQQGQLESAINALSYKIESAKTMVAEEIFLHMNVVEKLRTGVLKSFTTL